MHSIESTITPLIPILKCVACPSLETLELKRGPIDFSINVDLLDLHLFCNKCNEAYPITSDLIPILWDDEIKAILTQTKNSRAPLNAIEANITIYDDISDNYHLYTRRSQHIADRINNAAKVINSNIEKPNNDFNNGKEYSYHLDFGCGPGHVINWLSSTQMVHIGLDVSLNNLRNARKNTNCLVVCGSACNMPFGDGAINLVTESSVLHHISNWRQALRESIRVCKKPGGIIIDSEPSKAQLNWSPLATKVYNYRFGVYKILSYFMRSKYIYRDTNQAKLNLEAEIHHQPGGGFSLTEFEKFFESGGFKVKIISSPSASLGHKINFNWKEILISLLSLRNPWNPDYGPFIAIAYSK